MPPARPPSRRRRAIVVLCLVMASGTGISAAAPGDITRLPPGVQPNEESRNVAVSSGGRYVVFDSAASNLVSLDLNGAYDVFLYDRQQGALERVSVTSSGAGSNGHSATNYSAASVVADDGSAVVFASDATNLAGSDTNGETDVFVRDRLSGTTARASVPAAGGQADGASIDPSLSGDGRVVAFESVATNLVAGDTNADSDVFVRDRVAGTTSRISVSTAGLQADGPSYFPASSGDGRSIVFYSHATNLVAGDTNGEPDVFVRDRQAGTTTRVSVGAGGQANGPSVNPTISADGRVVVFESAASNLVPGDTNGVSDVFARDLVAGTTTRLSVGTDGEQADAGSFQPTIAGDGSAVAFWSDATTLIPLDTNGVSDVFVRDLTAQTTRRITNTGSAQSNGDSFTAGLSSEGGSSVVVFESGASNLVPGDSNGVQDVFLAEPDPAGPPAPTITAPAEGAVTNATSVTVAGTAGAGRPVRLYRSGALLGQTTATATGSWSISLDLGEGDHTLAARAFDLSGDAGPAATRSFTVDRTPPPAPAIDQPAEGATVASSAVAVGGASEPGSTVRLFEGTAQVGVTTAAGSGGWQVVVELADGPHQITARAADAAGNAGPSSPLRSFSVDTTGPTPPTITAPTEGSVTRAFDVPVAGTAEPGADVHVFEGPQELITATASGSGEWSAVLTPSEGTHAITARIRDESGTFGPPSAPRTFTVDRTAPGAPTITTPEQDATVGAGPVSFDGTAEPGSTVTIVEDGAAIGQVVAGGTGTWATLITMEAKGPHVIAARATDGAGNTGPFGPLRMFTVTTAAPTISEPAQGAFIGSTSVRISGTAEPGATVVVRDDAGPIGSAVAGDGTWTVTASFAEGAHALTATATLDGAASPASAPRAFTVDTTPPPAPTFVSPAEGAAVAVTTVTLAGDAEPFATVRVLEDELVLGTAAVGGSGAWSLTLDLASGPHAVVARATDRAGNTGAPSAVRTFTVAEQVSIDQPAEGSVHPAEVVVAGTSTAGQVRIYEAGVELARTVVQNGRWSLPLTFDGGGHTITVRGVTGGGLGPPSAPRSFSVDWFPPTVAFTSSSTLQVLTPGESLRGTATDQRAADSGVARVRLTYVDWLGRVAGEAVAACAACPAGAVTWEHVPEVLPGLYTVYARAEDLVGNAAARSRSVLVL